MSARRERKVVSVLFADLVGFTARSETLDPEDVEAILRPFHDRLRAELEHRGGTVEKFIGDAVMAVFGAPAAHEDDPERAVRAALAIRDWIREEGDLEVRIGVNTGEALVSLEPAAGAERGLVAGDVVNTASRLQSAAPVNGILVGETTYNATARVIEYREAAPVDAKGKSEPVPVWEVLEARSRFGTDVTRRPTTPLVGRERELALLTSTLARAEHERSAQLVTLVGVPGIGKSRLVHELFQQIDTRPELIYWRQGRCLPYGDGVAFWALGEIVKAHAGILEADPDERAARKLEAVVAEAVPEGADAAWVVRELRPLVGLAEDGDTSGNRRVESFAAWRRFFEGLAELDPLVLVFEDLHWADDGLLDFIDHLVDWAAGVPIFVVCTARPELLSRRPGWGGGKPNATTISLAPLTEQETATLVHGLLERAVLPADVQAALLERAGGNPLYAEEFARIAVARGALESPEALPMPESVQGLIAARLDALSGEEKSLVQDASVLGKVFWVGAVARLGDASDTRRVDELLHGLARKQFVQRERRSSMEGDTQYTFLHTLVRDVAYGQIPRADRTEKHRRAAAWIESLGRPEDHAELRAHHYASALDALPTGADDSHLRRSARLALREAGERAASLNAFAAAVHDYERALELTADDDPDRPRLLLSFAQERARAEVWDERDGAVARDALLAAGDEAGAAIAEILRAEALWNLARGDDVRESFERAAELAGRLAISPEKARVYAGLFRLDFLAQRERARKSFGDEALAMADELGLREIRAQILSALGAVQTMKGDLDGFATLEESIALFEEVNSADVQRAYNNLADGYFNHGRLDEAAESVRRMHEGWKRFASVDWLRWKDSQEIRLDYAIGRWDRVVETADRWLEDARERGGHYLETLWLWYRARVRLARGDRASALEDGTRALEVGRIGRDPQLVIPSLAFQSRLLWELGGEGAEDLALELVDRCRELELNLPHDWFPDAAAVLVGLGRRAGVEAVVEAASAATPWSDAGLALARGDSDAAAGIFERMGARAFEADAFLLAARGGHESNLPKAISFYREVGATAYLADAESLLATSRSA
ncbi:MAG TPA: adenylate/guanylate cyclase domain-containing protein [Gaiellaceae bacterium]|nr:adenylate/guanylate cyclase domain-containing protein [Gaiellaceae bacterium]